MMKKWIRECCASCQHKNIEKDGTRVCSVMQIIVRQQMKCPTWTAAEDLVNAAIGRGKVKRHEYLMFVFEVRMQEQEAIDNGILCPDDVATLDSLRKRFERETALSPFAIQ